jgi:peptidoglycan/xylan/chitin deacetylase (PgdA/CDA1 family)
MPAIPCIRPLADLTIMYQALIASLRRRSIRHLPLTILQTLTRGGPCIAVYHAVTSDLPEHLRYLSVSREISCFRRDLDCFLRYFHPIALDALIDGIIGDVPLPPNAIHLTCDDGLREAMEVFAPMCRKKGVPATFFLTTAFLDNQHLGDRHFASLLLERIHRLSAGSRRSVMAILESKYPNCIVPSRDWKDLLLSTKSPGHRSVLDLVAELIGFDPAAWLKSARPYAEVSEVQRLIANGFTIGAHTVNHPHFADISIEEQVRQTVTSVKQLREMFNISCTTFAFPFGARDVSPCFYDEVQRECGVEVFFGVGSASPTAGNRLVDRISLDHSTDVAATTVLRHVYASRVEQRARGVQEMLVPKSTGEVCKNVCH